MDLEAAAARGVRTLDRYLLREWLRVFLITLLGFPILVIVIDLTDKLDRYMSRGITKGAGDNGVQDHRAIG